MTDFLLSNSVKDNYWVFIAKTLIIKGYQL